MNNDFLTIELCKQQGLSVFTYGINVFGYIGTNGKHTLIQYGVVLIQDVNDVFWYMKDTFKYIDDNYKDKWTLVQDNIILISGADWVVWYGKNTYTYEKDGETVRIKNGKKVEQWKKN